MGGRSIVSIYVYIYIYIYIHIYKYILPKENIPLRLYIEAIDLPIVLYIQQLMRRRYVVMTLDRACRNVNVPIHQEAVAA